MSSPSDSCPAPKLIISDIDGTLIDSNDRVPTRVRSVIDRALAAGTHVALATGRPHRWIHDVLGQITPRPVCVTSNGAVLYDSAADQVIESTLLAPEVMSQVYAVAEEVFAPYGVLGVAAERPGVSSLDAPEDVFVISPDYLHTWEEQGFGVAETAEVLAHPAVKLILRNDVLSAKEMYELLAQRVDAQQAHITYSISMGMLEVAAPGVTKAHGLNRLCEIYGVDPSATIAFGDMPNDREMLAAAGTGVAVGNASDLVKAVADEVTATNDEAGLAQVLERWFP